MSEMEAAAAAPQSTQDIAASVITEAEHADTSSETSATGSASETRLDTTNTAEAASPEPKTTPTPAELSAAAKFLEKQGHKLKKEDGREVWLPAKTVEKMLDRYVDEHRTGWNGEKTTIEGRAKQLEDHINSLRASVAGDPRAFLSELAGIDPRYSAFLEQKREEARQAVPEQMPEPDLTLSDGSKTYSLQGLQALLEWNTKRVEGKLDERLKPFHEREKAEKQRAEQSRVEQQVATRVQQQLADAETWPGWAEHKDEILKALQEDSADAAKAGKQPTLSLEGAHRKVVMSKLLEDDGKRRERLLKEIQAAPKASALSRQTTDAPKAPGVLSTAEIARRVVAKAESVG